MEDNKPKYFNKGGCMEDFKIGDLVRFKGSSETDPVFMVTEVTTSTVNPGSLGLIYISDEGSPEKVWRIPAVCVTKMKTDNIRYVPSIDRGSETIVVGDVVALKAFPNIKMVVKEAAVNGSEITPVWYNSIKNKIEDIMNIHKECFDVYEMIVVTKDDKENAK